MEYSLYSIVNLKTMEVIELKTGTKLGYIKDIRIDCKSYNIVSIVLPSPKVTWFGRNENIEIPWSKIKKIGVDVILVDGSDLITNSKE